MWPLEKSFKLSDSQLPFPLNGPQTCLGNRALGGGRTVAYYQEYIYSILYITLLPIHKLRTILLPVGRERREDTAI